MEVMLITGRVYKLCIVLTLISCSQVISAEQITPTFQQSTIGAPTSTVAPTASTEELAREEGISVFDANSFPDKFRDIAVDWPSATDEDWKIYQEFVEAARAAFYEEQGIADEVAALTDINPRLKSLWGMIYWVQNNRDQVIAAQIMPVVTPLELRIIMEQEPRFRFWTGEPVTLNTGFTSAVHYSFGIGAGQGSHFNSQEMGRILGRNDINVPYNPYGSADGDEALLARIFPDDPTSAIVLLHLKTPPDGEYPYRHVLLATAVSFDSNFTLPAGTSCYAARTGETYLPREMPVEMPVGPLISDVGGGDPITIEQLFQDIGAKMSIAEYPIRAITNDGTFATFGCLHPKVQMEMIGRLQDFTVGTKGPFWSTEVWPW